MPAILAALAWVIVVARYALFVLAAVLFIVFALDWLARTRRISPFNPVARFFRRSVDPLLLPVERRVVRAGGMPTAAPWWALVAVVLGGIAIILALQFALDVLASAAFAASGGPRQIAVLLVDWAFGILKLALILRVVASWLRLSTWAWYLRWTVALTEWLLRPLRRVLPPFGMIDISPIVAYFVLALLQSLVLAQVR